MFSVGFKIQDAAAASGENGDDVDLCLILLKAGDDFWLLDCSPSSLWRLVSAACMAAAWCVCVCEERGSTSAAVSKMRGAFHPVYLAGFGASHPLIDSARINFEGVPFQIWVKTAPRAQLLPNNMCVSYPQLPSSTPSPSRRK